MLPPPALLCSFQHAPSIAHLFVAGCSAQQAALEEASCCSDGGVLCFLLGVAIVCSLLQILGLVGSARKRTLVIWQAVEFSRAHEMAITNTLQVTTHLLVTPSIEEVVRGRQELGFVV